MASNIFCVDGVRNISDTSCAKLPQEIKGIITAPKDFSLTFAEAAESSNWQDAIVAAKTARIYLFPFAFKGENVSEDIAYEETSLAEQLIRQGRYRWRLSFSNGINMEVAKQMATHISDESVFLIDSKNVIWGWEATTGSISGFDISLINPENLTFNDGSVATAKPVYISLADPSQMNLYAVPTDAAFVTTLKRLTEVEISIVGTPTATEIVAKVVSFVDNVPILGLVQADFSLVDGTGAAQTISGVTDNSDGTYTVAGTGLVSGELDLVSAATLSIQAYESNGPATVTIS
jgi:hypothetical protein